MIIIVIILLKKILFILRELLPRDMVLTSGVTKNNLEPESKLLIARVLFWRFSVTFTMKITILCKIFNIRFWFDHFHRKCRNYYSTAPLGIEPSTLVVERQQSYHWSVLSFNCINIKDREGILKSVIFGLKRAKQEAIEWPILRGFYENKRKKCRFSDHKFNDQFFIDQKNILFEHVPIPVYIYLSFRRIR